MPRRSRSPADDSRRTDGYRLNGEELRRLASEAGASNQRAIAVRAGVDEGALSRLLEGSRRPSLDTLVALATAFGCALEALLLDSDGSPLQIPAQTARTVTAVG